MTNQIQLPIIKLTNYYIIYDYIRLAVFALVAIMAIFMITGISDSIELTWYDNKNNRLLLVITLIIFIISGWVCKKMRTIGTISFSTDTIEIANQNTKVIYQINELVSAKLIYQGYKGKFNYIGAVGTNSGISILTLIDTNLNKTKNTFYVDTWEQEFKLTKIIETWNFDNIVIKGI